ncbi:hypothetical protein [Cupriavidus necator]|uniref:hypothetical protein n=1 Tax=Cupriavidus necator TaxID=106590 RepID=UPI00339D3916
MSDIKKFAGGRATEAGMAFQAAVTAWFAAQLLADIPIGAQFGLPRILKIVSLQCETGDALDDVVVRLEGGGAIYVQCKTKPSLTTAADSLLGKALKQVVDLYFQLGGDGLTATPNVALLAVAQDSPRSLDALEAACRMFDQGGDWDTVNAQIPEDKRNALTVFKTHVATAWASHTTEPLSRDELVALARLFRIHRFAEDSTQPEWRYASQLLGRRLFGGDQAGDGPMAALLGLGRKLIRTGAPVGRGGLLRVMPRCGNPLS